MRILENSQELMKKTVKRFLWNLLGHYPIDFKGFTRNDWEILKSTQGQFLGADAGFDEGRFG